MLLYSGVHRSRDSAGPLNPERITHTGSKYIRITNRQNKGKENVEEARKNDSKHLFARKEFFIPDVLPASINYMLILHSI